MNDTSRPTGQASSPQDGLPSSSESRSPARRSSERLQSALEQRLQESLNGLGSTIYSLAWRPHTTPAGRVIYRLRASARRTSASAPSSERSGWPTPAARDYKDGAAPSVVLSTRTDILPHAVQQAGWPTPTAQPDGKTPDAHLAMKKRMGERDGTGADRTAITDLQVMAKTAGPARITADGTLLTGSSAGMESGGQLNPAHPRWLQGYPPVWDDCAVTAMPSSLKSRRGS